MESGQCFHHLLAVLIGGGQRRRGGGMRLAQIFQKQVRCAILRIIGGVKTAGKRPPSLGLCRLHHGDELAVKLGLFVGPRKFRFVDLEKELYRAMGLIGVYAVGCVYSMGCICRVGKMQMRVVRHSADADGALLYAGHGPALEAAVHLQSFCKPAGRGLINML